MCLECGCNHPVPFGVKVLSVIAPGLLKPRVPDGPHTIEVHASLLAQNDDAAARNRARFASHGMLALNLLSSPGAGKTTLLSRTVDVFGHEQRCAVLVGDLETDNDARRIHRPHLPVVQITTGTACHLDAEMIARGLDTLSLDGVRVMFIENVGNLVCPAAFDLGETKRVVLLSATEGEDKPLKYPPIFKSADLVLLTKIDVADALGFDIATAVENIRRIAPQAELIQLSARSGEGMDEWHDFLRHHLPV
ncbi:MAG: hydrogenase nickel incorporation protein HypB [Luteolibacter sp.]|jgi:hydrogenase nickel incorporation protein HypB|nr:hydrogenase nickel incorporation protein HypB [Luteolibacter sp.]